MLSGGRFIFVQMNNSEDRISLEISLQSEDFDPRIEISRASKMFVLFPLGIRNVVGFHCFILNTILEKRSGMHESAEKAHYILQILPLFQKDV